ncbi:hypothetical protein ACLOJK_014066 [Asimina triloba]
MSIICRGYHKESRVLQYSSPWMFPSPLGLGAAISDATPKSQLFLRRNEKAEFLVGTELITQIDEGKFQLNWICFRSPLDSLSQLPSLPSLPFECNFAANYTNIKSKTPEEIRKIVNIKNDFTPEEEKEVQREN